MEGSRLALSVARTATAVLLATAITNGESTPGAAWAETFMIPDGDVSALIAAMQSANNNAEDDVIRLARRGTYIVNTTVSTIGGPSAFPPIAPDDGRRLEIRGSGSTIHRDKSAAPMRFFLVMEDAQLALYDLVLAGGLLTDGPEGGGAIRLRPESGLEIARSILRGNSSPVASAIHSSGSLVIEDSEILENVSPSSAAAIAGSHVMILSSTLRQNGGKEGGALLATDHLWMFNTTIAENHGFGIHMPAASATSYMSNVTIYGNAGSGLVMYSSEDGAPTLHNTVVAQNSLNCSIDVLLLASQNYTDDESCPAGDSFTIVEDVLLAALADNGGAHLPDGTSPRTMIPAPESPLLDAGHSQPCDSLGELQFDQRGNVRSIDGNSDGQWTCDVGAIEVQLFSPSGLDVDHTPFDSDGNGVFEPEEQVLLAPEWHYDGGLSLTDVDGEAWWFEGPPDASYWTHGTPHYELAPPGQPFTCQGGELDGCYMAWVSATKERPVHHWDTTLREGLYETVSQLAALHDWTLHIGDSFPDVPRSSAFYRSIETLFHHGVTGGCGGNSFCPDTIMPRQQIPVFALRALEGPDYSPPPCTSGPRTFADVPAANAFCPWIEELAERDVVGGCGGGDYCPSTPVTRAQMAVFMLRTLEGSSYAPLPCTSGSERFDDVPASGLFCPWIEELARREFVLGCNPGNYCPDDAVSRAQMSAFVTRTFGLELYGP